MLDHTADIRVRVYGESLESLLRNAALAAAGLITDVKEAGRSRSAAFEVSGDTPEELLVHMLGELIYIHHTRKMVFSDAAVEICGEGPIRAACTLTGGDYDHERHELRHDIKAATWHGLKVERENGRFIVEVVFDV